MHVHPLSRRASFTAAALLCLFSLCALTPAFSADAPAPTWDMTKQGGFVTALCRDRHGNTWAATEGKGVWAYSSAAGRWTSFRGKYAYAEDDCYALCCDGLGRVWCGGRHGLAVFSQGQWRRFTALDGPPGCRVFCLTTDPATGDVWGGTEAGLFHYALAANAWTAYTTLDGLPADAIQAVAFSASGRLFVATQADGIATGTRLDDYKTWALVPGPASPPDAPAGDGLPSALVNCLLGTADGAVWAGTADGLAVSRDSGETWRYVRGADWRAKALGRPHPPTLPRARRGDDDTLLTEDWVTCLAEDGAGAVWVGHRRTGWERWDGATQRRLGADAGADFVAALLPTGESGPGGAVLVGGYGAGLVTAADPSGAARTAQGAWINTPGTRFPGVPASARPPTLADLNAMLARLGAVPPEPDADKPFAVALADDWQTGGDWQGRYGRYWACLCALFHPIPLDYLWGAGWEPIDYQMEQGPDHNPGDSLRYWLQWRYTSDTRVLELPPTYLHSRVLKGYTGWDRGRRESEVDDHGEGMRPTRSGPGVFVTVTVPDGLFFLSLYDDNYNGHNPRQRTRDYRLSLRPHVGTGLDDNSGFDAQPELAHGRVTQFWGGVWKRFLVRGPQTLTVEIERNHSINTILPGVTLDLADEDPAPYFQTVEQWKGREAQRAELRGSLLAETPAAHAARFAPAATEREAASRLFGALGETRLTAPAWWGAHARPFALALLRWYRPAYDEAAPRPNALLASRFGACAYQSGLLPQWEQCQRQRGLKTARQIEKSLQWDGVTQSCSGLGYQIVSAKVTGAKMPPTEATGKRPTPRRTASRDVHGQ